MSFVEIALGEIFNLVDHDLHSLLVSAVVLPVLTNKNILNIFKSYLQAGVVLWLYVDSWTLYLPACVVVKVADACHAALCVFHHLGKLLINV